MPLGALPQQSSEFKLFKDVFFLHSLQGQYLEHFYNSYDQSMLDSLDEQVSQWRGKEAQIELLSCARDCLLMHHESWDVTSMVIFEYCEALMIGVKAELHFDLVTWSIWTVTVTYCDQVWSPCHNWCSGCRSKGMATSSLISMLFGCTSRIWTMP